MEPTPGGAAVAVLADAGALARAAATVIVDEARRAVEERGRFTLALSGGSTPKPVYRLLAGPPFAALMPWEATEIFWGDERCVAVSDPRSNQRMARESLLDHVPIPAGQVHPMSCAGGGAPGEAAARRSAADYEAVLRRALASTAGAGPEGSRATSPIRGRGARPEVPGAETAALDLVLLGLGDNGHTASLFPGSPALDERRRWVVAALEDPDTAALTSPPGAGADSGTAPGPGGGADSGTAPGPGGGAVSGAVARLWRVTLTAPFINRARLVLFLVSGSGKAAVTRQVLAGEGDPHELPALLIRPEPGRLWWLLDHEAAGPSR